MIDNLLEIRDLSKTFLLDNFRVNAVKNVSLKVGRGECLAIVGESGSGKTTVANMVLGVYPPTSGEIIYKGSTLPSNRTKEHRKALQLVQQNPFSSINPSRRIGSTLKLPLNVHNIGLKSERVAMAKELLAEVGIPPDFISRAPATLSGGQCQRVAIARALASRPELIVLDEPTSALDVLVQARVLILLKELRKTRGLTFIFITHDLAVVRNMADRVAVMKEGQLLEVNTTEKIFQNPDHEYTRNLIVASPSITNEEQDLQKGLKQFVAVDKEF